MSAGARRVQVARFTSRSVLAAAAALVLAASGCESPEYCRAWGSTPSWSDCGDKQTREIRCEPTGGAGATQPPKSFTCKCLVSGVIGKSFEMADTATLRDRERSTQIANTHCGWKVTTP